MKQRRPDRHSHDRAEPPSAVGVDLGQGGATIRARAFLEGRCVGDADVKPATPPSSRRQKAVDGLSTRMEPKRCDPSILGSR